MVSMVENGLVVLFAIILLLRYLFTELLSSHYYIVKCNYYYCIIIAFCFWLILSLLFFVFPYYVCLKQMEKIKTLPLCNGQYLIQNLASWVLCSFHPAASLYTTSPFCHSNSHLNMGEKCRKSCFDNMEMT